MINGEIVPILEAIEFSSKDELLTKLRDMGDVMSCPVAVCFSDCLWEGPLSIMMSMR